MMFDEAVLNATLSLWRRTEFVWEHGDCMMSVFNYVLELTGLDPGAEWRGTYSDEAGALSVLAVAGGGFRGMGKGLTGIGLKQVQYAMRGDPVCVRAGNYEIGGIYLGDMTALRIEGRGVLEVRVPHVGAWRV